MLVIPEDKIGDVYNRGSPIEGLSLADILDRSKYILLHISATFPFDMCPDHLIVDENKVSVIRNDFFGIKHVHSVLIEDITDVSVDTGLLFANIKIVDSDNPRFPVTYTIDYLKKRDALSARDLIQGLIAVQRKGINTDNTNRDRLARDFEQIGGTSFAM